MTIAVRILVVFIIMFYANPVMAKNPEKIYFNFEFSTIPILIKTEEERASIMNSSNLSNERKRLMLRPEITYISAYKKQLFYGGKKLPDGSYTWDVLEVNPNVYHLKFNKWKNFFWKVDLKTNKVFKINGGVYGTSGGREAVLNNITIERKKRLILLNTEVTYLEFGTRDGDIKFYWDDTIILDRDSFKVNRRSENIHFINTNISYAKYKLDLGFMKLFGLGRDDYEYDTGVNVSYSRKLKDKTVIRNFLSKKDETDGRVYVNYKTSHIIFNLKSEEERAKIKSRKDLSEKEINKYIRPKIRQIYGDNIELNYLNFKWDIWELEPDIYHIRFKKWKDFFWKVDRKTRQVYKVTRGRFGKKGGKEKIVKSIKVQNSKTDFFLRTSDAHIDLDVNKGRVDVYWANTLMLNSDSFRIQKGVSDSIYFKDKSSASDFKLKIDKQSKEFFIVLNGEERLTDIKVADSRKIVSAVQLKYQGKNRSPALELKNPEIWEDMAFKGLDIEQPKSAWIESEKKLYKDLLKQASYDVLVVPFQVQGYAIDRIGRSLMTRYLVDRIESSSDLKVANPTLVARSLGERNRSFNETEIIQLANDLRVKTLIIAYAGHDRNMHMRLTLQVKKSQPGFISGSTATKTFDWKNLSFSDEHLPSDVFLSMLDKIVKKLPLKLTNTSVRKKYRRVKVLPVPESIMKLADEEEKNHIKNAYYLQFLGMLFPMESPSKEYLFERSLALLTKVDSRSPDYNLLKARALFYLNRRPAAVKALGKVKADREKALKALLNGNLNDLKKWVNKIDLPLAKLMARMELYDLKWSYLGKTSDSEKLKELIESYPGLYIELFSYLTSNDSWAVVNNILVKKKLDESFPIEDYTAEKILRGRSTLGESPFDSDETNFAVHYHIQKMGIKSLANLELEGNPGSVNRIDQLDLFKNIGEANLIKGANLIIKYQGLPKAGLNILDSYESIYNGHPEMAFLRARAWNSIWRQKKGNDTDVSRGKFIKYASDAFRWLQGQTERSYVSEYLFGAEPENAYDADFPTRRYWDIRRSKDRKTYKNTLLKKETGSLSEKKKQALERLEIANAYSHNNLKAIELIIDELIDGEVKNIHDIYRKLAKGKFSGHPRLPKLEAKILSLENNPKKLKKVYEKAIKKNPESWKPYFELGKYLIQEGETDEATKIFNSYPFFSNGKDKSPITLTAYARYAGDELKYVGAFEEAKYFYELASGYATGSRSNILSQMSLSILNGNIPEGLMRARRIVSRYKKNYPEYLSLLFTMGKIEEAWQIFYERYRGSSIANDTTDAALIGLRMEGKTIEDIDEWREKLKTWSTKFNSPSTFFYKAGLLDRNNSERFSNLKGAWGGSWFADGFNNLKQNEYRKAYTNFKEKLKDFNNYSYPGKRFSLPYLALSAAKSEQAREVEKHLKIDKKKYGKDFYHYLSMAYFYGARSKHKTAMSNLKKAYFNVGNRNVKGFGGIPFLTWYQLLEAAEWLYENSGKKEYKNLTLEWSKKHQRLFPYYSWAYAFEAKYTASKMDRIRALGITLYLDKLSARISHFSEAEKKEAMKWMEKNNPFLIEHEDEQIIKTEI